MPNWILRRAPRWAYMFPLLAGLVGGGMSTCKLVAQVAMPEKPVTTLRVYENLIQIPVVVLGPMMELTKPIAAKRFYVSLDSGPPFRATHVRFEEDDPVALSILVDLDSDRSGVTNELGKAIAYLGTESLRSQDRVSIYALRHCEVWRAVFDAAPDLSALGRQVTTLKQDWPGALEKTDHAECGHRVLLLDALGRVVNQSATLPGRRVVLVVSKGADNKSKHSWTQISTLAAASGIAVFGLQVSGFDPDGFVPAPEGGERPYRELCESTGGLVFSTTASGLTRKLRNFMELLRKRYIVEFPRPDDVESGRHSIQVTVADSYAFIRSSGISVPIADAKTLADPSTVRSDPALAPKVGKRKPLEKE